MSSRGRIVVNQQNCLSRGYALTCDILQRRAGNVSRFENAECRARPRYLCEKEDYGENKRVGREEEKLVQAEEEAFTCLMGEE